MDPIKCNVCKTYCSNWGLTNSRTSCISLNMADIKNVSQNALASAFTRLGWYVFFAFSPSTSTLSCCSGSLCVWSLSPWPTEFLSSAKCCDLRQKFNAVLWYGYYYFQLHFVLQENKNSMQTKFFALHFLLS